MAYHMTLLNNAYENACKQLSKGGELTRYHKLTAAIATIDSYVEMLDKEPVVADQLDGMIATRKFQRAKQFEILGTV